MSKDRRVDLKPNIVFHTRHEDTSKNRGKSKKAMKNKCQYFCDDDWFIQNVIRYTNFSVLERQCMMLQSQREPEKREDLNFS